MCIRDSTEEPCGSRDVSDYVLQEEWHCETVCTAVVPDCCSSTAWEEQWAGEGFPDEVDRRHGLSIKIFDIE